MAPLRGAAPPHRPRMETAPTDTNSQQQRHLRCEESAHPRLPCSINRPWRPPWEAPTQQRRPLRPRPTGRRMRFSHREPPQRTLGAVAGPWPRRTRDAAGGARMRVGPRPAGTVLGRLYQRGKKRGSAFSAQPLWSGLLLGSFRGHPWPSLVKPSVCEMNTGS